MTKAKVEQRHIAEAKDFFNDERLQDLRHAFRHIDRGNISGNFDIEQVVEDLAKVLQNAQDKADEWNFDMDAAPRDGAKIDLWCRKEHCHGEINFVRKCDIHWGDIANQLSGNIYAGWRGLSEVYSELTPIAWRIITLPTQEKQT